MKKAIGIVGTLGFGLVLTFIMSGSAFGNLTTQVTFSPSQVSVKQVLVNGTTYDQISLPGCISFGDTGKPDLPVMLVHLVFSANEKPVSVSITGSIKDTLSGNYYVFPAQPNIPMGKTHTFVPPDSVTYASNDTFPNQSAVVLGSGFNYKKEQNIK